MSNLLKHAKRELEAAGYSEGDDMSALMRDNVLQLIKVFSKQGHSGFSAPFCVSLFKTLASYKPLGPLKGTDDEWNDVSEGLYQNNRCSRVFKDSGGAYDIDGYIFEREGEEGCWFTDFNSRRPVTFPYFPKSEYVRINKDGTHTTLKAQGGADDE